MNGSGLATMLKRILGGSMLAVGLSVFLVRLGHAGPYALPQGGNLAGGLLALALGGWLAFRAPGTGQFDKIGTALALLASPVVLFLALYATLAEVEEVVVLKAPSSSGEAANLRLWIVDLEGFSWIVMPIQKAREHGLDGARVEMLREGELHCVETTVTSDRETVTAVRDARYERYAIQRLATAMGIFTRAPGPDAIVERVAPGPDRTRSSTRSMNRPHPARPTPLPAGSPVQVRAGAQVRDDPPTRWLRVVDRAPSNVVEWVHWRSRCVCPAC